MHIFLASSCAAAKEEVDEETAPDAPMPPTSEKEKRNICNVESPRPSRTLPLRDMPAQTEVGSISLFEGLTDSRSCLVQEVHESVRFIVENAGSMADIQFVTICPALGLIGSPGSGVGPIC